MLGVCFSILALSFQLCRDTQVFSSWNDTVWRNLYLIYKTIKISCVEINLLPLTSIKCLNSIVLIG